MKQLFINVVGLILILPMFLAAQPSQLPIDDSHSFIGFSVGFAGVSLALRGGSIVLRVM